MAKTKSTILCPNGFFALFSHQSRLFSRDSLDKLQTGVPLSLPNGTRNVFGSMNFGISCCH